MCEIMEHYKKIAYEEGKQETAKKIVLTLALNYSTFGITEDRIASVVEFPVETVREWIKDQTS